MCHSIRKWPILSSPQYSRDATCILSRNDLLFPNINMDTSRVPSFGANWFRQPGKGHDGATRPVREWGGEDISSVLGQLERRREYFYKQQDYNGFGRTLGALEITALERFADVRICSDPICPNSFPSCKTSLHENPQWSQDRTRDSSHRNLRHEPVYPHLCHRCHQSLVGRVSI